MTICRYFDNGYCRFETKCKYYHSKEKCVEETCGGRGCHKRHPRNCKFYSKGKCKFNDKCAFKHSTLNVVNSETKNSEHIKLENQVKVLEYENENLKKENNIKDFNIHVQNESLKDIKNKVRLLQCDNH